MARLERLPNELFERIVEHLDLGSICSLRLVNHQVSQKTNQNRLQSFLYTQSVAVTPQSLSAFAQATTGFIGQTVRDLTLVDLIYDDETFQGLSNAGLEPVPIPPRPRFVKCSEGDRDHVKRSMEIARRQGTHPPSSLLQSVGLLREAFNNIAQVSQQRGLERLSFEVQVVGRTSSAVGLVRDTSPMSPIRDNATVVASELVALAMESLRTSNLRRIQALDLFTSAPASFCCSIALDVLSRTFSAKSPATPPLLDNVRTLSVSFTDPRAVVSAKRLSELEVELSQASYVFGLTELLQACPNVESLHLSRSGTLWSLTVPGIVKFCRFTLLQRQLQHLIQNVKLSNLHKLRLSGLSMEAPHLANFFLAFGQTLQNVELLSVRIKGALSIALAPFTDGTIPVQSLVLENLFEYDNRVEGRRGQDKPQPVLSERGGSRWSVIRRYGDDVRRPIEYFINDVPQDLSEEDERYYEARHDECHP